MSEREGGAGVIQGAVIFQKEVRIEESVLDEAEFKLVGS